MLLMLGLGLRLWIWQGHERYPLGGDERAYFQQMLTLLQTRQFVDLDFMRPPFYTLLLAALTLVGDSLVQWLRLAQALIGTLTIIPLAGLAANIAGRRAGLIAAGLAAFDITLAVRATELLSETLFVAGLVGLFWLLTPRRAGPLALWRALLAGVVLGTLALTRSVALPLLPLAALWPALRPAGGGFRRGYPLLVLATLLTIAPWTARNALTYGSFILIDTTGAENLWLDNNPAAATPADPLGREAAKRVLYAMGNDRAGRAALATREGLAAITSRPDWFLAKAWGEAQKLAALEFFDDLRERRAIWVPPVEVWARLVLGDGLWLVLVFGGALGLWLLRSAGPDPRLPLVLWCAYVLGTMLLFHVELRYRLPLYPVLQVYAAALLARVRIGPRRATLRVPIPDLVPPLLRARGRVVGAAATIAGIALLMLLQRGYPAEVMWLADKHLALVQGNAALARGDLAGARRAARRAQAADPQSALAPLLAARAALAAGDQESARALADQAVAAVPAHPQAHLLRGALRRERGDAAAARDLAYETATLDDAQRWAWDAFAPLAQATQRAAVVLGDGLDLGAIRGFHAAEPGGGRYTRGAGEIRLLLSPGARELLITLAPSRPAGQPAPVVEVLLDGVALGVLPFAAELRLPLPPAAADRRVVVTVRSAAYQPRALDRVSPDTRDLGVLVLRVVAQ